MNGERSVIRGLTAAGVSWMLLVGAITLGMRVPREELLDDFDSDGKLDYSAFATLLAPLSAGFIAEMLGLADPPAALADGSKGQDAAAASKARTPVPMAGNASVATRTPPRMATAVSGSTRTPPRMAAAGPTDVEHPFTNDDVESAYPVPFLPFRGGTDTSDGTRRPSEPSDCFAAGGTAWYRYRPKRDVALFSDTFGTPRPTALGVYTRTDRGGFDLVGCDRNALGNAQVGFPAEAGTAYYFQVTSMARGGRTKFGLAAVGRTTVETIAPSGAPADGPAFDRADISADGRYVVFTSFARNLTPHPPNCGNYLYCGSVYLRDRLTHQTALISSNGTSGPPQMGDNDSNFSLFPAVSPGGRYVGFGMPPAPAKGGLGMNTGRPEAGQPGYSSYLYDRMTGRAELVSRNSTGEPARSPLTSNAGAPLLAGSMGPSVSADGRYAVFISDGENLPGSTLSHFNVYRRDLVTGKTRLVSTTPSGEPNHATNCAVTGRNVSGDGRYAVYWSTYGPGDGTLVYLWDARSGASRLVSKVLPGEDVRGSYCPSISLDGSRVGLVSRDPLVPEDTNGLPDVYVYEVATERIQRISVTSDGQQTHDPKYEGREHGHLGRSVNLSADGRFAVFDSSAPDLAPSAVGSTRHPPETTRVFVHDILTGATVLASVSSAGEPLGGDSHMPYISADGSAVVFMNTPVGGQERVMVHELSFFP